ncbi:MAG: hypothetical protein EHM32_03775, partial [Spirochaetales bacterium]
MRRCRRFRNIYSGSIEKNTCAHDKRLQSLIQRNWRPVIFPCYPPPVCTEAEPTASCRILICLDLMPPMPILSKNHRSTPVKKRLFVIDGHALCYRAYFAFIKNPLTNSKGQNTSAIFGFARMLFKLVADQKPDYLVVAFDPPKKSFRFALYPEYKANREKMPDDLRSQIEEIKLMVGTLGIRRIEEADYEADDVLGTIARAHASNSLEVVLVTGDKDAYQLVDDNTSIYANKKGITEFESYDAAAVRGKLGIDPAQVIDYMALVGDTSDNIPGVRGVGEKTALKLIQEYGSLDRIYSNLD